VEHLASDTLVVMADGSAQPINSVRVGQMVLSEDSTTRVVAAHPVTALFLHDDTDAADITVATNSGPKVIHSTLSHQFWDETLGTWTPVNELRKGDRLHTGNGDRLTVSMVVPVHGTRQMYDLSVRDDHTFFVAVGETRVLVHNAFPCGQIIVTADDDLIAATQTIRRADGARGLRGNYAAGRIEGTTGPEGIIIGRSEGIDGRPPGLLKRVSTRKRMFSIRPPNAE
jgi:hypothetical protein